MELERCEATSHFGWAATTCDDFGDFSGEGEADLPGVLLHIWSKREAQEGGR